MRVNSGKLAVIAALLGLQYYAYGQIQLSTIRGTVIDASGAAVVGAKVSVTDVKTNVTKRTAVADGDGNFEVPDLVAGVYRVSVESPGFKSFVADNLVLEGSQIRRVEARLELGQLTEQITVQAGVTPITTDSAQITSNIKRQIYDESPMVRNYYPHSLLASLSGVESQGSSWSLTINGQPPTQVAMGMDGVTNDGTVNLVNRLDFSELTVTGVSNTADQPRVANYNMISKRGDNGYHGEAYFTHFNSAMNARSFFDPIKPATKEHRAQLAFSGPIIKNKTFFYVSYFYLKIPAGVYLQRSVANNAMRGGDFSQLLPQTTVKDPLTGQPFPGNIIPSSRINPTSANIQENYLPKPNMGAPGDLVNNYGYIHPFPSDLFEARYPQIRFDHNFSSKNSIYGRWIRRRTPYVLSSQLPQFVWTRFRSHGAWVVNDTHVFSPRLVNSARWGLKTDFIEDGTEIAGVKPLEASGTIQKMGLQGVNQTGLKNVQGAPTLNITGFTGFSMPGGGVVNDNHLYSYADSLTWSIGRHVVKFGGELKTVQEFLGSIPDPTFGNFNFNGSLSGHAYADFLLGMPFTSSRLSPLVNRHRREKEFGLYVTDSFKVTQKLSLDYGIRWDYFTAPRFDDGLQYAWDPANGNVIVPDSTVSKISPLYPKNIGIVTGNVFPTPDKKNIRPRFGFAYRLRDKSVIRGGYGIFTETLGYFARLQGVGPFQISETYNNQGPDGRPIFAFPNPFPSSLANAAIPSQSITAFPMQTDNGSIHQFNLTLEQQVGDLGFRLSYIGSRSRGLNYNLAINKPQPGLVAFTQARRPYPQFIGVTMAQNDGRSNFNSLQFEVQRKVGAIITFDAHYTLQSAVSDFLNLENPYNHKMWNRDPFSARHRAVFATVIDLPFGKGKPFLADVPAAVNYAIGGWRLTTMSMLTSGQFFSPSYSGSDPSNTNTVGGLPDRICDGNLPYGDRTIDRWFDPKCFAVPAPGRFGNSGVNILKRPGYFIHHLTMAKDFKLNERFKMEFVTSVSNLFNQAVFNPPISNISTAGTGRLTSILVGADLSIEGTRAREIGMTLRLRW
ncbi:MAG: carboxypeptidase regulatory-like domain-containing protein [Bryobacterales bacterium]|nr:carboxypeptidase regulatory-like domain-containing protein [Bryobacterales bacterium]